MIVMFTKGLKMTPTSRKILDLINTAVDLAENVEQDVKESRRITNSTIAILSTFLSQYQELTPLLDLVAKSLPKPSSTEGH